MKQDQNFIQTQLFLVYLRLLTFSVRTSRRVLIVINGFIYIRFASLRGQNLNSRFKHVSQNDKEMKKRERSWKSGKTYKNINSLALSRFRSFSPSVTGTKKVIIFIYQFRRTECFIKVLIDNGTINGNSLNNCHLIPIRINGMTLFDVCEEYVMNVIDIYWIQSEFLHMR